jgi:hypothetical protein
MKVKGMRDVLGSQSVVNRSRQHTREQAVTDLTRLEHEKARLERELTVWTSKQETTSGRLAQVSAELASLQNSLYPPPTTDVERPADPMRSASGPTGRDAAERETPWRGIPMEY